MQAQLRWVFAMAALVAVATGFVCPPALAVGPYLSDVQKRPAYARALKRLFDGAVNLPSWSREVLKPKGYIVEAPVKQTVTEGTVYETFFHCQPHNCDVTALVIMFGPQGRQAWGLVVSEEGPASYLGAPNAAQRAIMNRALPARLQSPFD